MTARIVAIAIVLGTLSEVYTAEPSVVIGKIEAIEVFGSEHYKHERAFYDHNTTQSFVLRVARTLAGPNVPERVVVLMEVRPVARYAVTPEASWFLLSPREWRMGSEILIRLSTESPYGGSCFVRLPQERERGFVYADPMIDAHRDLPVYCSDIVDSWRTAGDDK